MAAVSDQVRANRVAGGRKAAATRKRMAELRRFMADGTPVSGGGTPGAGPRGAGAAMGFSIPEIMARIRAGAAEGD